MFIEIYNKLAAQGPLSEEKIFDTAMELLQEKIEAQRDERLAITENQEPVPSLTDRFASAAETAKQTVDIKDIFKE